MINTVIFGVYFHTCGIYSVPFAAYKVVKFLYKNTFAHKVVGRYIFRTYSSMLSVQFWRMSISTSHLLIVPTLTPINLHSTYALHMYISHFTVCHVKYVIVCYWPIFSLSFKGTGTRDLIWLKVVSLDRS